MKYFEQETDYTCGVACMRMVISHFDKNIPSEEDLIDRLQTNNQIGTHPNNIVKVAEELGYAFIMEENGDLKKLDFLTSQGYICMLAVSVDVPHWIIYVNNNNNHIFFNDPFFGENKAHSIKDFFSEKRKYPFMRWRIIQSEFIKYWPDYDFSSIESKGLYIAIKKF